MALSSILTVACDPFFRSIEMNYTIREFRESDLPGVIQLQHPYEGDGCDKLQNVASIFRWLFQNNPHSIQQVLVGVDNQERIVAHYAVVPFQLIKGGATLLGGLPCKLVVAEDFRKTLLFRDLELTLLKQYKSAGLDFLYAPVAKARVLTAHLALGFQSLGVAPVYARPYQLRRLITHFIRSKALCMVLQPLFWLVDRLLRLNWRRCGKIEVIEADRFDAGMNSCLEKLQRQFDICAIRTSSILNWRFADFPHRDYQILIAKDGGDMLGYAVLRFMRMFEFDVLAIVDILYSSERRDAGYALFRKIHDLALKIRADLSVCLLNPDSPFLPTLKRHGFLKTPEGFSLIVHEPEGGDVKFKPGSFEQWHLTWFDHDYV